MLYVIGLGLYDEKDITVRLHRHCSDGAGGYTVVKVVYDAFFRGLEAVKKCKTIYLEAYTSMLLVSKDRLVSSLAQMTL